MKKLLLEMWLRNLNAMKNEARTILQRRALVLLGACIWMCTQLSGCSGSYEPTNPASLNQCYVNEFGSPLPDGVQVQQVKIVGVGDAEGRFFRFKANQAVIESILRRGFKPSSLETFRSMSIGGYPPDWWRPEGDKLIHFYQNKEWTKHSSESVSYAYIGFNAERNLVYVQIAASW